MVEGEVDNQRMFKVEEHEKCCTVLIHRRRKQKNFEDFLLEFRKFLANNRDIYPKTLIYIYSVMGKEPIKKYKKDWNWEMNKKNKNRDEKKVTNEESFSKRQNYVKKKCWVCGALMT